eukprot:TRINITY_DN17207_c0_g1_i2.p1 TRINITY_DN17207_c0_g1~~TRINITY_DN17207_c0_g1_i2.p1  ORF type:complete len:310 (+),score=72.57 TRINITY_DN17207_c0_g1_i2:61-930(+)
MEIDRQIQEALQERVSSIATINQAALLKAEYLKKRISLESQVTANERVEEDERLQPSIELLQEQCAELSRKVEALNSTPLPKAQHETSKLERLVEKKNLLKAQIQLIETDQLDYEELESRDPNVIKSEYEEDLDRMMDDLDVTTKQLEKWRDEYDREFASQSQFLEEHKYIQDVLQERWEKANEHAEEMERQRLDEAEDVVRQYERENAELEAALSEFIKNNWKDEAGNHLEALLKELMDKQISEPHHPYVQIDANKRWQPFIELFLRSGIAEKHPKDPKQLKLTTFHR